MPGPRIQRLALLLALLVMLTACNQNNPYGTSGDCCPTVAGVNPGASPASYQAARDKFTRMSKGGVITATLKDASWLKFQGPPEQVMQRHRDYFEYVYTSFEVVLRVKDFTNPNAETFVLEDSTGQRVAGRPIKYETLLLPVDDRHEFTFDLAFKHQLTKDMTWIRVTRVLDGETVEWSFTGTATPTTASRDI